MFNVVLCNSYLLSSVKSQDQFRVLLYKRMLQVGTSSRKRRWVDSGPEVALFQETLCPDTGDQAEEPAIEHQRVHQGKKGMCKGCRLIGRARDSNKRRVLGEISLNTRWNGRAKESVYGCSACEVALCRDGGCFEQYHNNHQ